VKRRQFIALSAVAALSNKVAALTTTRRTGLVLDERFTEHHIRPAHPESPARYQAIRDSLLANNIIGSISIIPPKKNSEKWLIFVHQQQHIDSIKTKQPETHQHALLATAGVLAAVDALFSNQIDNAFCASRPPGHHASNAGSEEGFCYYNHVAIAARYAQNNYGIKKVLIVDWDYHHGNGTEWAFYSDPDVLYFSTHDMFAYPGTGSPSRTGEGAGKGFNVNVHLACGATDSDIIEAFQHQLLPLLDHFSPELILISAGFDSRQDDLLGCHHVTDQGFVSLTEMIKVIAEQNCAGKIISVLEGGYNIQGNASATTEHLKSLMT
jgi:acetoin utilization deacetylase AcuC-like enzyme